MRIKPKYDGSSLCWCGAIQVFPESCTNVRDGKGVCTNTCLKLIDDYTALKEREKAARLTTGDFNGA